MRDKIQQIREKALAEIDKADGLEKLNDVRAAILGKKGELTAVLKGMKDVAPDERPKVGQWVNETREAVEKLLDEKVKKFEAEALKRKYESEKIDVTMPAKRSKKGNLHPVTQVKDQLSEIFTSMGFEVYEGTEIENDYYNFTALNTPKDHPARDMQDTFYLSLSSYFVHRPQQDRFTLWKQRSRLSRLFHRVRFSVRMMMQHILLCSHRWRDLW